MNFYRHVMYALSLSKTGQVSASQYILLSFYRSDVTILGRRLSLVLVIEETRLVVDRCLFGSWDST